MKTYKWGVTSEGEKELSVVLFISRNKDNKSVPDFKERSYSFIISDSEPTNNLIKDFSNFVNKGVPGEVSRLYFSINTRDRNKVQKDLIHFLIDEPNFDLTSINSKLAGIAMKKENALTKKWMFDFDINDLNAVEDFVKDIKSIDENIKVQFASTKNGYVVITNRGFDTRELFKKWDPKEVNLKRDGMKLIDWDMKDGK